MKQWIPILITFTFLVCACSIKKRSYRDGYYLKWNTGIEQQTLTNKKESVTAAIDEKNNQLEVNNKIAEKLFVSVENENKFLIENISYPELFKDTCGDIIRLRKGSDVKAKILEINETQVKYKRCDNPDGPLIVISKNDVYSIRYSNGVLERFERISPQVNSPVEKPVHQLAIVTLALTIGIPLLGIFGLVGAIITGNKARKKILAEPDKYKGLEIVKICLIVCYVFIALAAAFLIFLFYSLGVLAI